jgi:hypothetical protein
MLNLSGVRFVFPDRVRGTFKEIDWLVFSVVRPRASLASGQGLLFGGKENPLFTLVGWMVEHVASPQARHRLTSGDFLVAPDHRSRIG